ncbi:MAG: NAD(P)/FAD-dependent oxidoreductase [Hyphomicrobiaceae bacterium]|nr:NAD(P)/FAD-dependent oxidoreductase [Hyphomicrobiaceae bacterium]
MVDFDRREFAKLLGKAGVTAAVGGVGTSGAWAQVASPNVARSAPARIVIIGGGPGGGTLAHILRRGSPEIDVTLIEANAQYTTCFFSNLYLGGFRTFESLVHDYAGLTSIGVRLITDMATDVDAVAKVVTLKSGAKVPYDKLVLSPGIDFKFEAIPGFTAASSDIMPHAYKAGPQTRLLHDQLRAMPDGGTVVLAAPPNPFRCPPGPYERVCMIANYLKTQKPRSKLVLLDPKKTFSKQALFMESFTRDYAGIVEVHLTTDIDNHALKSVDLQTMEIETMAGLKVKANVANIIPPQKAGRIAHIVGCNDGDWCPIDPENFASTKVKDVYVVGDSSAAGDMPKSAFSANSQAKSVSNDLESMYAGKPRYPSRYRNTCWSMLGPSNSVKIGAFYEPKDGKVVTKLGFVSDAEEDNRTREKSFKESLGWYAGIVAEVFNKRVEI